MNPVIAKSFVESIHERYGNVWRFRSLKDIIELSKIGEAEFFILNGSSIISLEDMQKYILAKIEGCIIDIEDYYMGDSEERMEEGYSSLENLKRMKEFWTDFTEEKLLKMCDVIVKDRKLSSPKYDDISDFLPGEDDYKGFFDLNGGRDDLLGDYFHLMVYNYIHYTLDDDVKIEKANPYLKSDIIDIYNERLERFKGIELPDIKVIEKELSLFDRKEVNDCLNAISEHIDKLKPLQQQQLLDELLEKYQYEEENWME